MPEEILNDTIADEVINPVDGLSEDVIKTEEEVAEEVTEATDEAENVELVDDEAEV